MGNARRFIRASILVVVAYFFLLFSIGAAPVWCVDKVYHHLVILGDPHLPGKNLEAKERVIRNINAWSDVEMVIAVGDICEDRGTSLEYAQAKKYFAELEKPFCPVAGNHDFIYEDLLSASGKRKKATAATVDMKLKKFRTVFELPATCYSRKVDGYLLIFLSPELSDHLSEMSDQQIEWLRSDLDKNQKVPTIIFFHAPLKGTLRDYSEHVNSKDFIAQPSRKIHDILMKNPQVFLWVSGHTHTSPKEESFASSVNVYEKRITNIHNTDMNRETIWTNSLLLYPDRVVIKTYDHKKGAWLQELEREVTIPQL
ncbi:MAG: metallophosphoesterase [Syntrophobacteraceae bacterium]